MQSVSIPMLSVFDENGNEIAIPAIVGKSAYQYAVSNGYTGTEEEFAEAMNPNNFNGSTEEYGNKFQLIDKELENLSDQLSDTVSVTQQTLSATEKEQVRTNIGTVIAEYLIGVFEELKARLSEMDVEGAIAVLDDAILDMCVLA